jgi:sulfur-oxidizing protein SoxX
MGNIGPTLSGVAQRLSAAQMRLRIVDQSRLNPATVMPAYYRTEGLSLVAPSFQGKPVLNAQQIEDVIAYLQTLK